MDIQENISLKPYNTFGIDVNANQFIVVEDISNLKSILILKILKDLLLITNLKELRKLKKMKKLFILKYQQVRFGMISFYIVLIMVILELKICR